MTKSNAYIICGTDTDVGKTIVCSGLLKNISGARGIKIIQTGACLFDQNCYKDAHESAVTTTIKHFTLAASPHLAADTEQSYLSVESLFHEVTKNINNESVTLIEGSGGILTPINHEETFVHLMIKLGFPVILVIKNTLGAINHALLTINELVRQQIEIVGFIFTHHSPFKTQEEELIAKDNIKIIEEISKIPVLDVLPYISELGTTSERAQGWKLVAKHLQNTAHILQSKELSASNDEKILVTFDQQHIWHPYTTAMNNHNIEIVEKAKGCYFSLKSGKNILDGMSSWWSAIHGYSHPELVEAIQSQTTNMSHIMFGGLTHEPAISLGKKILTLVPKGLNNIFYSDSGSVAVEVAMKMAIQYFYAQGQVQKNKFISFMGGYHGDTFGAMSVCDPINGMHNLFQNSLKKNFFAPRPDSPFHCPYNPDSINDVKKLIENHHHECAALIIEPIVQGAGGMWFYHFEYLKALRALCTEFNLVLIVDEIATGFGRTGKMFASNWAGITPDIMCIGKALTGGCISLAATITTKQIAQGISIKEHVLMHGPTYMGNPLACHVASHSIELLLKSPWEARIKQIEQILKSELLECLEYPDVQDVRVLGAIGVVEMKAKVNTEKLQQFFVHKRGVWIRPFSNLLYIMPPYIIQPEEVLVLTSAIKAALGEQAWV